MKPIKIIILLCSLLALSLVWGCADDNDPELSSIEFLGSAACAVCHGDIYTTFVETGHNFKLNKVSGAAPTYPSFTPGVPNPPAGVNWADVTYVIGGYGWKARFLDSNGYIITGAAVQYNLGDSSWSAYKDGQSNVQYDSDCGSCHTTGWSPNGNQDGLAGMAGTFALQGVQCEACHGAGGAHVDLVSTDYITKDTTAAACGRCHYRTTKDTLILASGTGMQTLIRHHEQYNEFLASPHATALTCVTCHDPHKTAKYDSVTTYTGIRKTCQSCHTSITSYHDSTPAAVAVTCTDCHMSKLVKSAIVTQAATGNAPDVGDIKSHIMKINPTPGAGSQFYTSGSNTYSNLYLTLEYVCLQCHTGNDVTWAQTNAAMIHTGP